MFWRKQPSAVKGLAAGALGGLIASWIMGYAHTAFDKAAETVSKPNQSAKAPASDEEQANVKAAVAVAHAVGTELSPPQEQRAGTFVHYAYGTLLGAGYGVAAEYSALPRAGVGTAFGAALWLVSDEVAVPALHLAKPPQEYAVEVHVSALAAHLV